MQSNDALQRLCLLRARLNDLRNKSEAVSADLGKTLSEISTDITAIEKSFEEKDNADKSHLLFLENILDSFTDPLFVKDRKHRYVLVNIAESKLAGRRPEEMIGKTCFDFFPEEKADLYWQMDEAVFSTGMESIDEENVTDDQGIARIMLTKKTLYVDEAGNQFLVGIARDITDIKRIDEQLQMANDRLEKRVFQRTADLERANKALMDTRDSLDKIINSIGDPIHVKDRQHRIILVNDVACKLFNRPREEILGKTAFELFSSLEDARVSWQKDEEVFATWVENVNEETNTYAPGVTRTVLIKKTPYRDKSGNEYLVGVTRDISDRKQAEEALRESERKYSLLIKNASEAIIVAQDGQIKFVNPMTISLLGVHSEQDLISRPFSEFLHPADRQMVFDNYRRRIASQDAPPRYSFRVVTPEGAIKWVEINATLIDWQGRRATLNFLTEITEKKLAEEKLIEAKEAAEAAARSKSDFLANMSHEIRTPLNAVLGLTGLLLNSDLNAQERDYVETVRSSGNTLLSVINDILDFSKIEGGKMELESQLFNLRECISVAVDLIMPSAGQKGLAMKCDLDESIPAYIKGDVTRLRQVLVNLLGNAVKFTNDGTISLSVTASPLDSPEASSDSEYLLHFSISDTGIGIPGEKLDRLFRSFSQVDSTTTRKYGGTGLGLAISRKLVEMMGGEIWVVSEPNVGSTFHFTIRAEVSEEQAAPSDPELAVPMVSRQEGIRSLRILLAEDNAVNQMVAKQMLKKLGYSADVAGNGLEVLQAIERQSYDVILMDVQMPEMDGLAASQEIRRRWPTGPRIIAITAYALKGDRERCLAAGMDDYVSKPIVIEELKRVLERCESSLGNLRNSRDSEQEASPLSPSSCPGGKDKSPLSYPAE
ncbi:MAG TPA: PAS domain S-box protein [Methanothrix sp.]|nr:PAS domain S-box protein [Methanothrix sp.]